MNQDKFRLLKRPSTNETERGDGRRTIESCRKTKMPTNVPNVEVSDSIRICRLAASMRPFFYYSIQYIL